MWLHRVYFHHTLQPTWSTAHAYCIILWTFEDITRSAYVNSGEDPCIHYWNYFKTSKCHITWIISKVNSIHTHCSVAYESVLSPVQRLRLRWKDAAMISKTIKKRISTPNFETSSLPEVTAKKPIGNMYFMYVDMAWFHSLSWLEHEMLHLTVWPVHKIFPMPMCWWPYPTRTKRMIFLPFLPGMLYYNRNLWFLLKNRRMQNNIILRGNNWF